MPALFELVVSGRALFGPDVRTHHTPWPAVEDQNQSAGGQLLVTVSAVLCVAQNHKVFGLRSISWPVGRFVFHRGFFLSVWCIWSTQGAGKGQPPDARKDPELNPNRVELVPRNLDTLAAPISASTTPGHDRGSGLRYVAVVCLPGTVAQTGTGVGAGVRPLVYHSSQLDDEFRR